MSNLHNGFFNLIKSLFLSLVISRPKINNNFNTNTISMNFNFLPSYSVTFLKAAGIHSIFAKNVKHSQRFPGFTEKMVLPYPRIGQYPDG